MDPFEWESHNVDCVCKVRKCVCVCDRRLLNAKEGAQSSILIGRTMMVGIFGLGSFAWDRLCGIFRMGIFVSLTFRRVRTLLMIRCRDER